MSAGGPPMGPPPPGGNVDRGPQLVGLYWFWSASSLCLVALRFYARYKIRSIGWDDWMMLITVLLLCISSAFITYMASIGGARHVYYLPPETILEAVKYSWISQPWAIFLFATGKASIAILTLRFIGRNTFWRKWILYFVIVTIFIVNSLACIFTFVQCNPPAALWTPGLPATCWDPSVQMHYNYFVSAWNIAADVVLATLPATFIGGLNLRKSKKIALSILLGLGLFAAAFSVVKTTYLGDLGARSDFTWNAYDVQVWTGAEAFVMIVCGNMPPLQPLWDRYVTHKLDSSYGRTPLKYATPMSKSKSSGSPGASQARSMGHYSGFDPTQSQVSDYGMDYNAYPPLQIYTTTGVHVRPDTREFV